MFVFCIKNNVKSEKNVVKGYLFTETSIYYFYMLCPQLLVFSISKQLCMSAQAGEEL